MQKYMIRNFRISLLSAAVVVLIATAGCMKKKGCTDKNACNYDKEAGKDDGSCIKEPAGMVTAYITTSSFLNFDNGDIQGGCYGGMDMGFSPFNFYYCTYGSTGIADVGKVSCLGGVTTKPSSGYASAVATELGHGYVVKLINNTYARVYAEEWMLSLSGGVIGIKISWQYPW